MTIKSESTQHSATALSVAERRVRPAINEYVCLRDLQGDMKVVQLLPKATIRFGKHPQIDVETLLALPYGATITHKELDEADANGEVNHNEKAATSDIATANCNTTTETSVVAMESEETGSGKKSKKGSGKKGAGAKPKLQWLRTERTVLGVMADGEVEKEQSLLQEGKTNQWFAQDGSAQTLSQAEIALLKEEEGLGGEDLIRRIAGASATFGEKTMFSQAKYIARKQKKYLHQVTLLQVTPTVLCEYYQKEKASKVGYMKFEVLSGLLWHGNVFGHQHQAMPSSTATETSSKITTPSDVVTTMIKNQTPAPRHFWRGFGQEYTKQKSRKRSQQNEDAEHKVVVEDGKAEQASTSTMVGTTGDPVVKSATSSAPGHQRVLVYDEVGGLLSGAVHYRMHGPNEHATVTASTEMASGHIFRIHNNVGAPSNACEQLNCPLPRVLPFDFAERLEQDDEVQENITDKVAAASATTTSTSRAKTSNESLISDFVALPTKEDCLNNATNPKFEDRLKRCIARQKLVDDFTAEKFDVFIVALNPNQYDQEQDMISPSSTSTGVDSSSSMTQRILRLAEKYLRGSGVLAVYSSQFQALAELQSRMRLSFVSNASEVDATGESIRKQWTCVKMHEYFTREWQVLPMRTHPLMDSALPLVQGFVVAGTLVDFDLQADRADVADREAAAQLANELGFNSKGSGGGAKRRKKGRR
ncbi:unnamed protein product [Amoebophrya sp. A25]|nr:unnamed protein product [Amoebophrya sp. A25]|eukprot:GSA25T00004295001.1